MNKSLHSWKLACLAAVSILIVSCGSAADYRDLLPADSFVTMSINPSSLMQKGGIGDPEQNPLYVRIKSEIENGRNFSDEEKQYLLSLLKNPCESGIDLKSDLFYFISGSSLNPEAMYVKGGVLLPIGDKAKFDALIARINEKSGARAETANGVSVIRIGEQGAVNGVCAYSDAACMLYFAQGPGDDAVARVKELFAQKRSESLMGNKVVAEQFAAKNDINMVLSYAGLSSLANNPMLSSMPMMSAMMDATVTGSVNFEKGRIVADAAVSYKDKESEEKVKEFYAYVKPQDGDLLRYLPAATIGAVAYGLDGEKLFTVLSSLPGYGMMLANPLVKQVMDAFDGDMVIAFSGMLPGSNNSVPVASLLAQVDDPSVVQTVIVNMPGMPVQQTGDGQYSLTMSGVTVLFGVKDGVLYCTTDALVKSALDGEQIASLVSREKIFKGQSGSFYLDIAGLNEQLRQILADKSGTSTEVQVLFALLGMFDNLESYGTMKGGTMVFNMADKEQNSFKTICDTTGELIRQYVPGANL